MIVLPSDIPMGQVTNAWEKGIWFRMCVTAMLVTAATETHLGGTSLHFPHQEKIKEALVYLLPTPCHRHQIPETRRSCKPWLLLQLFGLGLQIFDMNEARGALCDKQEFSENR